YALIGISVVLAIILIPIMVNDELRLDLAHRTGLVPAREGELVASGDSGASLIVIPTEHDIASTDRTELRFLAAFIAWPEAGELRLQPLNGGEDFVVPMAAYEHVSASPDGTELYLRGDDRAALVDVANAKVIEELPADSEPDVSWDWQTAVWDHGAFICDRVSNTGAWIGCFPRPGLASYFAGDWQLDLHRYGNPDETYEVVRGLGFRPTIGFTEDDAWLYTFNEHGIRRFDVAKITDSD
ncbi:MAG TPA: hypothetical protein VD789_05225, partial [Thermomicrobiales bacterium]|nr:hypothetical protein [Thermomicrobiales bacterium]